MTLALAEEILYLVDPPSLSETYRKVNYEITTKPDFNSNMPLNSIEWKYRNATGNAKIKEQGVVNITRDLGADIGKHSTAVKAGYPDALEKNVDVNWVDEGRTSVQVIPPAIQNTVETIFESFESIQKIVDKFGSKDIEISPKIKIRGTKYNKEDEKSRHYIEVKDGSINADLELKFEVPLPPPYSFDLTIPVLKYKLGKIGAFINLKTIFGINGGLVYERKNDTDNFTLKKNTIGVRGTGRIEFGAEIDLLSDVKSVELDFRAYGKASLTAYGKYIITKEGEDDFDVQIYFDPLIGVLSGKIKAGGYLIFDDKLEFELLNRFRIYPPEKEEE